MSIQSMFRWASLAGIVAALSACGGGGGDTSPPPVAQTPGTLPPPAPTPAPATGPALRFSPANIRASAVAGVSATITVSASALRAQEINGPVFAQIADSVGIILPNAHVLAISETEYKAVMQTAPNLAPGTYKGNFVVKLCRDEACSSQHPGSPVDLPYELTVVPATATTLAAVAETTLDATMHLGTAPKRLNVSVGASQMTWSVTSSVAWAKPVVSDGSGSGSFAVDFNSTGLAEGLYRGEIRVSTGDGQRVVLPISLNVIPGAFSIADNGFAFAAVNGAPIASQAIAFALDSQAAAPWTLASDSAWMSATPSSGTTPGSASLSVDPTRGNLASGHYVAQLTLRSPYGKDRSVPVQLTLTKPTLSASVNSVVLGGTYGREFKSMPLKLSLNTGSNAWPWTIGTQPAWLKTSATAGTVGESGSALTLSGDPEQATLGSSTIMLNAQAKVNGDTVSKKVAVTINRDQHKILPSLVGIAMVSTPGWSRLSRQVTVSDNYGANAAWSAASDRGWLSVTRNGATLLLQADPASLPADTTSYATVTLTPADSGVTAPEKIRVGLWKGSSPAAARTELASSYVQVVADPIRPLVYVRKPGSTSVDVINVYSAQKVEPIALGITPVSMAVAPDGQHLYAVDLYTHGVTVVDLNTRAIGPTWTPSSPSQTVSATPLRVIRPNGVEIVISGYGTYRANDGKQLSETQYDTPMMAASDDGKQLYAITGESHYAVLRSITTDYAELGGGTLFSAQLAGIDYLSSRNWDLAASADGSRVYTAGEGTPCRAWDKKLRFVSLIENPRSYANNVEIDSFGRIICGYDSYYAQIDVGIHNVKGGKLKTYRLAGSTSYLYPGQLVASSDGMMLIGLTNDPRMVIVAVGP